jgi:hypothetical protein
LALKSRSPRWPVKPVTEPTGWPVRSVLTRRSVKEKYMNPFFSSTAIPCTWPDGHAPPYTSVGNSGLPAA